MIYPIAKFHGRSALKSGSKAALLKPIKIPGSLPRMYLCFEGGMGTDETFFLMQRIAKCEKKKKV